MGWGGGHKHITFPVSRVLFSELSRVLDPVRPFAVPPVSFPLLRKQTCVNNANQVQNDIYLPWFGFVLGFIFPYWKRGIEI